MHPLIQEKIPVPFKKHWAIERGSIVKIDTDNYGTIIGYCHESITNRDELKLLHYNDGIPVKEGGISFVTDLSNSITWEILPDNKMTAYRYEMYETFSDVDYDLLCLDLLLDREQEFEYEKLACETILNPPNELIGWRYVENGFMWKYLGDGDFILLESTKPCKALHIEKIGEYTGELH